MNIGYIYTNDKIKYSKSNFKIVSFTTKYSKPLITSYNGKLKDKLIIIFKVIEEFKEHIKCSIIDVIGSLNDINLLTTLKHIYSIYRKKIYKLCENKYEKQIIRINITDRKIFSIDPDNCIDIDDAISYEVYDTHYMIYIYIAQPISFISEELLMSRVKTAFSTLYDKDILHLWGDDITYNSSFIKQKIRNAVCIEFKIIEHKIHSIHHYNCTIKCNINTTYEKCYNYDIISQFINISNIIINISNNQHIDSHECIEFWMIQVNKYIGNLKLNNIPYRVTKNKYNIEKYNNIDIEYINKIFKYKLFNSASYEYGSIDDKNSLYHESLDIYNYTHFTSPIRRIIDTVIHWCITYNVDFKELLDKYKINLDDINILNKSTNKYHKDLKTIDYVNNILKIKESIKMCGYIFNLTNNISTVYFKELGFKKVKLWDEKFNHLVDNTKIEQLNYGSEYEFLIKYKEDFLPSMKIYILPLNINIYK